MDICEEKVDEWSGEDEEGNEEENQDGGTISLDNRGEWIEAEGGGEELEYDQGYEWVQNYKYNGQVDDDNGKDGYDDDFDNDEAGKRNIAENE